MISAILLSAGLSSRFGSPKALAQIDGLEVIKRILTTLIDSQVAEIIVVLGDSADKLKPYILNHKKVSVVYNKDYNLGQTSSFQAGLGGLNLATNGLLLLPVDFPLIKTDTIDQLIKEFSTGKCKILIPTYEGQKGHPPIFDISLKEEILGLDTSIGLNSVAQAHSEETSFCEVSDQGVVVTFNTVEELEKIVERTF